MRLFLILLVSNIPIIILIVKQFIALPITIEDILTWIWIIPYFVIIYIVLRLKNIKEKRFWLKAFFTMGPFISWLYIKEKAHLKKIKPNKSLKKVILFVYNKLLVLFMLFMILGAIIANVGFAKSGNILGIFALSLLILLGNLVFIHRLNIDENILDAKYIEYPSYLFTGFYRYYKNVFLKTPEYVFSTPKLNRKILSLEESKPENIRSRYIIIVVLWIVQNIFLFLPNPVTDLIYMYMFSIFLLFMFLSLRKFNWNKKMLITFILIAVLQSILSYWVLYLR